MKRSNLFLSACCLTALIAGTAIGQPKTDPKPAAPAPAAQHGKTEHAMPAKMEQAQPVADDAKAAEMMAQMKKSWEESVALGDMHTFLTNGCGEWDGKCTMWCDPSGKPDESTCVTKMTPMMGGRFVKSETLGTMKDFDKKPIKFEGFGLYGYNNTTKQFESTWCDNMGTMQMHFTGTLSSDKKTLTWESKFMCPMMHQETWMREVQTFNGPDSMTLQMWGPDMADPKKEAKMMEIVYTRKAGTAPKADAAKDMKPATAAVPTGH